MRPTLRTVLVFGGGIPVSMIAVLLSSRLWTLWLAYVAAALLIAGLDSVLTVPRRRLRLTSALPDALYIGDQDPLVIELAAPGARRAVAVEIVCDLDEQLLRQPAALALIEIGGVARVEVPLVPKRRGRVEIKRVWLRWSGPFGLTRRLLSHPIERAVPVIPNVRAVRSAALRFSSRDALYGMKSERYAGDGSEFESLRDYVRGLDPRAIDWKHSARHRRLVCKEYRAERNHQIILAIDTGYLMSQPMSGIPKLDHAVNAALLLSYFSLRGGDRVGLFGFGEKVHFFSEPAGGVQTFGRLQQLSANFTYSTGETNFTLGLADLKTRLRRRSLIVLLTDFVDTITAELMLENIQRLTRRHLVVFVTLRDHRLQEIVEATPHNLTTMHRAVVADDFVRERDVVLRKLSQLGVQCLDVPPEKVSVGVLNRYLDIKRRELI